MCAYMAVRLQIANKLHQSFAYVSMMLSIHDHQILQTIYQFFYLIKNSASAELEL